VEKGSLGDLWCEQFLSDVSAHIASFARERGTASKRPVKSIRVKNALARTYAEVLRNHTLQMAAALSYYFVLSLSPSLIFLSAVPVPDLLQPFAVGTVAAKGRFAHVRCSGNTPAWKPKLVCASSSENTHYAVLNETPECAQGCH
jgi:hypothetical protein